ncbi:matrixin family metalloprotease [Mycolicibacterium vanbaalenii]|uniref:Peptidase M10 metallopeptidase domain-containing protein n=1 Tax=Mycolicibacterium vanbaalenii (strain DSM 7251 / JCM 13017 / BCRC 16820 / KCTC 9966 / NRRL B-24157 / PYR-1) TaxID=350058 RepID=A1THU2_MYCVP|nr:matrixin family metalloprotease [Mycolicibacterium vanbaalenii]ABM16742.1 hypothetical protein Mvan_5986 [Mycolicibacterium vanbaalenii PYR-1]MCV7128334.1 matrixin family metalloprotease [Mycolicibacterium vanbaalenii PYR-1]
MTPLIRGRHGTATDLVAFRARYSSPRPTGRHQPEPRSAGSLFAGFPALLIVVALLIGSALLSHPEPAATTPYVAAGGAAPVADRPIQPSAAPTPTPEQEPQQSVFSPIARPAHPWLDEEPGGEPVAWACAPIGYRVVLEGAPAGVEQLLAEATARISAVSGHQFRADRPLHWLEERSTPYVGITVAWVARAEHPEASQDAIAIARTTTTPTPSGGSLYSAGKVHIFSDWPGAHRMNFTANGVGPVMLHELGHALGLGHSDDRDAMMHPTNLGVTTWSEPERAALRYLRQSCR